MINDKTAARILELGQNLWAAGDELNRVFGELSSEADAQLAATAQAFVTQYATNNSPVWHAYVDAHKALLKAAVAAANIRDMAERANSLSGKTAFWANIGGRGQVPSDIRHVCGEKTRQDAERFAAAVKAATRSAEGEPEFEAWLNDPKRKPAAWPQEFYLLPAHFDMVSAAPHMPCVPSGLWMSEQYKGHNVWVNYLS